MCLAHTRTRPHTHARTRVRCAGPDRHAKVPHSTAQDWPRGSVTEPAQQGDAGEGGGGDARGAAGGGAGTSMGRYKAEGELAW
jgi:hypothetical protein